MAEFEFAGITFRGGKIFILLTALSTLGGTSWAAFEFYKDYMDMKEVVANIDVSAIEARNNIIETKLDEAIDYTRDIKSDLLFKIALKAQFLELPFVNRGGRIRQGAGRACCLGEGNDLPDRFNARHDSRQAIETESHTAVWGGAVFQGL